jgi:hypothetical protein
MLSWHEYLGPTTIFKASAQAVTGSPVSSTAVDFGESMPS